MPYAAQTYCVATTVILAERMTFPCETRVIFWGMGGEPKKRTEVTPDHVIWVQIYRRP